MSMRRFNVKVRDKTYAIIAARVDQHVGYACFSDEEGILAITVERPDEIRDMGETSSFGEKLRVIYDAVPGSEQTGEAERAWRVREDRLRSQGVHAYGQPDD